MYVIKIIYPHVMSFAWFSVIEEEQTGQINAKYLRNESRTGRGGGSWATPHQRPRAFCMTPSGTGQSRLSNKGHLCTMRCPVRRALGSGRGRFWEQVRVLYAALAQCGVRGRRRRCGPGAASLATASRAAHTPVAASPPRRAPRRPARRRVTPWLFLFVLIHKGLPTVKCREL